MTVSCTFFDEDELILPGKRESVFDFEDDIIVKSNEKIFIGKQKIVESWPQQYQNERNHLFHFESKSTLKLVKKLSLNDIAFDKIDHVTIPVFNNDTIFYADNDYNIYSKDTKTSKVNWKIELENEKDEKLPFIGGFAFHDRFLILTTGLGNVYVLDEKTGKILWSKKLLVQISRPPLVFKTKIFVVSDDNQTFALNLISGQIIWSHVGNLEEVSIIGGSKPIISNNILVVSYSSGEIYALNENDGSLIWFDNITSGNFINKSALNDIQSPLTIVDEKVYVPTFSDKFIVYELENGNEVWSLRLSSVNPIVISGESIYLIDTTGRLLCLDKKKGKLMWAVQLKISTGGDEVTWYGPLLSSNKLLLNNSKGSVLSISPFSGKLLSRVNFSEEFVTNPIQIDKKVLLISKEGSVFILG
ncbi:MAG: PQQ-binding-like beta-propeller repeat protein [Pseudomonadota bacterium]|nr:PQQ-binding-like beta-propeller repeat protein [Pseudomonadota bacterium]